MEKLKLNDKSFYIKNEDVVFETAEEKCLGEGSFGKVFIARLTGIEVAAKKLHKKVFSLNSAASAADLKKAFKTEYSFHQEYLLLSRLHHPHIVQLYGIYRPDNQPGTTPVIIMELLSKTLRSVIINGPKLILLEVLDYSLQITSALCYLHGQSPPVIHRDLTTNNIMLSSYGDCKIVDLGLAKVFDETARKELTSRPGNTCYMPVEVLTGIEQYDERLDVFSFNIVMLEMSNGRVSQPAKDLLVKQEGGLFAPIEETKRYASDLEYLGSDHPLREIIVRLMQPVKSLLSVVEVHKELQSLRQNNSVVSRSSEDIRAMRRYQDQREEDHREEMKCLTEMVSSGQQAMQESLQKMATMQQTMQDELAKVKMEVAEKVKSAHEATMEEVLKTSRQIQQICKHQQDMVNTIEQTDTVVKVLRTNTTTTEKKVDTLIRRQLQKCNRECAAPECQGTCIKPQHQFHGRDECCCGKSGCTVDCSICNHPKRKCSSKDHLHKVGYQQHHHCGLEHPCAKMCQQPGICTLIKSRQHSGLKQKCAIMQPKGSIGHPSQHSCLRQHTCDKKCRLCGYFCELPYSHSGKCRTSSHGPARNLNGVDGVRICRADGVEMKLEPTLTCDKLCQAAGRGHSHILMCNCKPSPTAAGKSNLQSQPKRAHRHTQGAEKIDFAAHSVFWNSLQPSFADPATQEEQREFDSCPAVCPHCHPPLKAIPSSCTETVHHKPCKTEEKNAQHFLFNGHSFPCDDHKCRKQCQRLAFRWNIFCGGPCVYENFHDPGCRCEYHSGYRPQQHNGTAPSTSVW